MKKEKMVVLTSIEATRLKREHFNLYQTGHGVHGNTKYNRNKQKEKDCRDKEEQEQER